MSYQGVSDLLRLAERVEVPAGEHLDVAADSLTCDAALEVEREQAVVVAGEHGRRDVRPALERAGLLEGDVRLRPLRGAAPSAATAGGTSCRKYVSRSNASG